MGNMDSEKKGDKNGGKTTVEKPDQRPLSIIQVPTKGKQTNKQTPQTRGKKQINKKTHENQKPKKKKKQFSHCGLKVYVV